MNAELEVVMLPAALVPLMFIVGLLVLFALGTWPLEPATFVVAVLLVMLAVMLVRYLRDGRTAAP